MKWTHQQLSFDTSQSEENAPCVVTVFYDNTSSRHQAVNLSHRLTREFHGKIPLEISWWKFRCLEEPTLAHEATVAAAHADIVIVAANVEFDLPEVVSDSIASCAHLRTKPDGLLVAFANPDKTNRASDSMHPMIGQLQRLAKNAELDFLPNTHYEHLESHEKILDRIGHQTHDGSSTLRDAMITHDLRR